MSEPSAGSPPANLVERIGERLTTTCLAIAAISLFGIVAINGINVLARYLFRAPYPWAEELMLFLMILSVFAGAIAVTWRNIHIRIDALVERASRPVRIAARIIGTAVAVGAILTVVSASLHIISLLYEMEQRSDALRAPSWIPQSFVPIGLGIIALLMVVRLVMELLQERRSGSEDGR